MYGRTCAPFGVEKSLLFLAFAPEVPLPARTIAEGTDVAVRAALGAAARCESGHVVWRRYVYRVRPSR
jgi:hypothetical protein